ncbi:unnamed protein product [Haemonchus placei]|uniref:UPAR/Ly6 domain-containing protein n=1 Tax=Haemonchus placei TaxID=6290 RepID=A0A0N4X779_HAEPC|nr:unnamed protein product [Haemonchus placei]
MTQVFALPYIKKSSSPKQHCYVFFCIFLIQPRFATVGIFHYCFQVRYCDGTGVSSICQTYRIFETCESIPNLGFICCCSGNLCNSSITSPHLITLIVSFLFLLYRFN